MIGGLVLGIGARCAVSTLGHNFDTESYAIVAVAVEQVENVYAATPRYNYGPPWSYVVHRLAVWSWGFKRPFEAFKWMLTVLLTAVDIGIAAMLLQRAGPPACLMFFLNPVSIIITGYHRQFDNSALLLGMLCVSLLDRDARGRAWVGSSVLGLSLAVKHVLFALPFWLMPKERTWWERAVVLCLPIGLFCAGFVPYWAGGREGIVYNVLLYRSLANAPLWSVVLPSEVLGLISPTALFLLVLVVAGVLLRNRPRFELFLFYCLVLVIAAPAVSNQALAIVCAPIAVFPNAAFALFTVAATLFLLTDAHGLGLEGVKEALSGWDVGYGTQVLLLAGGFVWVLAGPRVRAYLGGRSRAHHQGPSAGVDPDDGSRS